MSRLLRLTLATVSAGVLATTTTAVAHADAAFGAPAPPVCQVNVGQDASGVIKLPGNAVALLVTDVSNAGTRATVTADLFDTSTRIPLGASKTDANGLTILEIPSGTKGSYTVDVDADCGPSIQPPPNEKDPQLVLDTAAVEIPTSVGSISVRPSSKPGPQESIALDLSEGLRAFLPAAVLEMTVNERPAVKITKANLGTDNTINAQTGFVCVENGVLHREKRTVKITVTAKIAGVTQLPAPATVDVTVDCGAIQWTSGVPGTTPDGTTTTTTPSGSTTTTTGGCAAAPIAPGSTPAGAAFAAIALGAVVVLVRRRRA